MNKKHFKQLDFPIFPTVYDELRELLTTDRIKWREGEWQLCLNSTIDHPNDYHHGNGSLFFDWGASYVETTDGIDNVVVPLRTDKLEEKDFTVLCEVFRGTAFERLYAYLNSRYILGRVRIIKSQSKTCLSWHADHTDRIHYSIKTQPGCFMCIEDEMVHMPENTWWWTNTVYNHTAFNASKGDRIHLVAVILGKR